MWQLGPGHGQGDEERGQGRGLEADGACWGQLWQRGWVWARPAGGEDGAALLAGSSSGPGGDPGRR